MKFRLHIILLSSLIYLKCQSQSMTFQINSIGATPQMTTGSLSFQMQNMANCVFLANGLSIYKPQASKTDFSSGCVFPIQFDHYGLVIYPQPIGNLPRVKLTNKFIPNTNFTISCYDINGKLVIQEIRNGMELSYGSIINTSQLSVGAYIVQVVSDKSLDIVQVIKQD